MTKQEAINAASKLLQKIYHDDRGLPSVPQGGKRSNTAKVNSRDK